jgi:N-methylhydantoinase A
VRAFNSADRAAIAALFEDAYRRLYSRPIPGVDIEILSWVVTVSAPAQGELARALPVRLTEPKARTQRPLFDPQAGEFQDVPIYWRRDLAPGAKIAGPAVIAEDDTSTVVSPLFEAQVDKFGYIALARREV